MFHRKILDCKQLISSCEDSIFSRESRPLAPWNRLINAATPTLPPKSAIFRSDKRPTISRETSASSPALESLSSETKPITIARRCNQREMEVYGAVAVIQRPFGRCFSGYPRAFFGESCARENSGTGVVSERRRHLRERSRGGNRGFRWTT